MPYDCSRLLKILRQTEHPSQIVDSAIAREFNIATRSFTRSIDDALWFLNEKLPTWNWVVTRNNCAEIAPPGGNEPKRDKSVFIHAATPAIALVTAVITAIAQREEKHIRRDERIERGWWDQTTLPS